MTRELPDELLSAYLDGEVTTEERAAVEAHLATSEAARQLLDELRSLRGDMAALPRVKVTADFSDRVVQAAVAARAAAAPAVGPARRGRRNWMVIAVGVAATAACLLIAVQFWRPAPVQGPFAVPITPVDPTIAALRAALPDEGQAVVLRVRWPKNVPLETALAMASANAGIGSKMADASTGGSELGKAYQAQLARRIGAAALADATVQAADAMFVEAPLAHLEKMVTVLSQNAKGTLELRRELQLADIRPPVLPGDGAEGSDPPSQVHDSAIYLQHLPASLYRLEKQTATVAVVPNSSAVNPNRLVRVLILIEQVEVK